MLGEINYQGRWPSLNQLYARTWQERKAIQDEFKAMLRPAIIKADLGSIAFFKLRFEYNSRYDVDNNVGATKIACDLMREMGIIRNDTQNIYRGLEIIPNKDLPGQSFKSIIY